MNEEIEKGLESMLMKALELAEQTGEFVIEQSPILLQEFYAWHIASSIIGIICSFIVISIVIMYPRWFGTVEESLYDSQIGKRYYTEDAVIGFWIVHAVGAVTFITMFTINTIDLVKILIAPRLYLIDYFTQ